MVHEKGKKEGKRADIDCGGLNNFNLIPLLFFDTCNFSARPKSIPDDLSSQFTIQGPWRCAAEALHLILSMFLAISEMGKSDLRSRIRQSDLLIAFVMKCWS